MKLVGLLTLEFFLIFFYYGCSSSKSNSDSQSVQETNSETTKLKGKKSCYKGVYQDTIGIKYFDTKTGLDTLILDMSADNYWVDSYLSPQKDRIVFSYTGHSKNETYLYAFFFKNHKLVCFKKNSGYYQVNVFWEDDSLLYCNFCSFKQNSETKLWTDMSGYTELINTNQNKVVKKFKPRKGGILIDYIQKKYLVYDDYTSYYLIDKSKNTLFKELPYMGFKDKQNIKYSPDGKKLFYTRSRKLIDKDGNLHGTSNELFLANYDGTNEKNIIPYSFDPKNIKWSPQSDKICCDISSQEWSNIHHVSIYDLNTDKATYKTEELYGFMPSLNNCIWSPSGEYLLIFSEIERQFQTIRSYFFRDVYTDRNLPASNGEVLSIPTKFMSLRYYWWDDNQIIFCYSAVDYDGGDAFKVFNLKDNNFTFLPFHRSYLYIGESL